eukprot:CAMPEP_0176504238 /NCGR_PEP_ID=MMETSP0200_2-20121128/15814_1 /TAXON_ID=947934 /ORGANISM="Chaetoceros sp., Strain GSL56" /LENGTH=157 /DNA_ID=CAMNT_0017903631 /DNA_START=571 /DNA_END=1044 /DNA_ORIENTATION=+
MSTSVTKSLEEIFSQTTSVNEPISSNRLLTKEDNINNGQEQQQQQQQKDFALVYISSDTSVDEMKDYMKWNWIGIPFDSPDRNELKRYFKTCAQNEMEELGIDARRFEIPSLFILDTVTQDIISTNGVGDLQYYGEEVLDHWLEIQSLMRALEDKYV